MLRLALSYSQMESNKLYLACSCRVAVSACDSVWTSTIRASTTDLRCHSATGVFTSLKNGFRFRPENYCQLWLRPALFRHGYPPNY